MNLYVVRHTEAAKVGGAITRDADRVLTMHGEEDAALMGRALALCDPAITMIVTSPLQRAMQTGEIIGREIGRHPALHVSHNLAPGFQHMEFYGELSALCTGESIVAVGHQPDLGEFISFLIGGSVRACIAMPPGAIAQICVPFPLARSEAHLGWLLTPDLVTSLHSQYDKRSQP